MTTLTLPFTEGFNTIAGKIRQLGGKFITTGTGTTRTLVFSNMPESVLSLIWRVIEKENVTPETDAESAGVWKTETPETMQVETEQTEPVATAPVEESVDSPRRRYEGSELEELTIEKENATPETDAESVGVPETEAPEAMEVVTEQTELVATEPVEKSADSPSRRYEGSELEELTIEKENATPETDAESVGVPETETPETMEVEAEQTEPVATDAVEESVDSLSRRYEGSELEELTKSEILLLAERLEIDMTPVLKKRKSEMIAHFLVHQK